MKILAIDTSCDETAAAVTEDTKVLSNIIWSQASAHAKFGGVMPSLAQRMHEERIDWVIQKALGNRDLALDIDAVAVTIGPGLSIALGVGVGKAKEIAKKYNKPLIAVNHTEAHLLSPLARQNKQIKLPSYGLVISGGNTVFAKINKIGDYDILAQTVDDALGEALDKGARMLGLGYPGGAILEKMARLHKVSARQARFNLPIPLVGQEKRQIFSYSGLKTSFYRLIESNRLKDKNFPSKQEVYDLAATFQDVAFRHIERVLSYYLIHNSSFNIHDLFLGGGVAANIEIRKRLRRLGTKFGFKVHVPYSLKLCGDNAAMIGVCAFLNQNFVDPEKIDRNPRLMLK